MCRNAPSSSHIARIDSYVFAMLLDSSDEAHARAEARAILRWIGAPYRVGGRQAHFTLSGGIALSQPWGDGNAGLMDRARTAFWRSLERSDGDLVSFDIGMDAGSPHIISLADDLRDALCLGELSLTYQPVLDLVSGEILSVEVVPKWMHALKGAVPADVIRSIADRFGMAIALGDLVLADVCSQIGHWRRERGLQCKTLVQLSDNQVCDPRLVDRVLTTVADSGIDSSEITFGVNEATVFSRWKSVLPTIRDLTTAGVACTLNGYSGRLLTPARLQALPVDELRIDKSLIHSIMRNRYDMALVDGIVAISDALGLRVVADGVDTHEQQTLLAELGCNAVQGFFIGRRLAGRDVPDFVEAARRLPLFPTRLSDSVTVGAPIY